MPQAERVAAGLLLALAVFAGACSDRRGNAAATVPGTSGSGTAPSGGALPPATPGTGLHGGLGASGSGLSGSFPAQGTASAPSGSVAAPRTDGSPNTTRGGSVGNR